MGAGWKSESSEEEGSRIGADSESPGCWLSFSGGIRLGWAGVIGTAVLDDAGGFELLFVGTEGLTGWVWEVFPGAELLDFAGVNTPGSNCCCSRPAGLGRFGFFPRRGAPDWRFCPWVLGDAFLAGERSSLLVLEGMLTIGEEGQGGDGGCCYGDLGTGCTWGFECFLRDLRLPEILT